MENKICTSLEQTKKLIELGIDINTADLTVIDLPIQNGDRFKFISSKLPNDTFPSITDGKSERVPAWSLSALLDILPLEIETHKQTDGHKIYYHVESYMKRIGKEIYLSTERHENLIDACYEMIIKLHELNLL